MPFRLTVRLSFLVIIAMLGLGCAIASSKEGRIAQVFRLLQRNGFDPAAAHQLESVLAGPRDAQITGFEQTLADRVRIVTRDASGASEYEAEYQFINGTWLLFSEEILVRTKL